jgi:WD40 repeat protein
VVGSSERRSDGSSGAQANFPEAGTLGRRRPHQVTGCHGVPALALAVDATGRYALTSSLDFELQLWELASGYCLHRWDARGPLYAIDLHPTSDQVFLGCVGGVVVWNWRRWQYEKTFFTPEGGVQTVRYANVPDIVLGGSEDTLIHRWRATESEVLPALVGHSLPVSALALASSQRVLLSGDIGGSLRLWDPVESDCLHAWTGHRAAVTAAGISSDGRLAATAGRDGTIRLWDTATAQCTLSLAVYSGAGEAIALVCGDRYLVSGGTDGLRLWELPGGRCLAHHTGPDVAALELDLGGHRVVALSRRSALWTWELEERQDDDERA